MKVIVTGAAGFIGMHVVNRLLKEGNEVIGIDNLNDYYSVDLKLSRLQEVRKVSAAHNIKFTFYQADILSDIWKNFDSEPIDCLVHLAAQAGVRYSIENPRAYLESNIIGFQNILDFVKSKGIKRFIYASSSSVYGNDSVQPFRETAPSNSPQSYYAATKKSNELMAKSYFNTYGIVSIGLRFFTVYGPWGRPDMAPMIFAKAAFDNEPIKVFNYGNQSRDFTYIDDIVEGLFGLIGAFDFINSAEILNIGFGAPTRLMDFIHEIEKQCEITFNKELVKPQIGDVTETYADISSIKKITQFHPSVGIELGVSRFIDWYMKYFKIG